MVRCTNLASGYLVTRGSWALGSKALACPRDPAACGRLLPVRGLGRNPLWSASAGQVGSTGPKPNTHRGQRSKAILISVAAMMRVDLIRVLGAWVTHGGHMHTENGRPLQVSSSTSYSEPGQS